MGIPLEVQFRHLNTFSKQAVNIFGDIESPYITDFCLLCLEMSYFFFNIEYFSKVSKYRDLLDRDLLDRDLLDQDLLDQHLLFTKQPPVIDTYTAFINNWNSAKEAIKTACSAKPAFAKFLEDMSREHKKKLTLDALLIMPVQRIPRYEMLIKELLKHTQVDHPDHHPLLVALDEVHNLAVKIDHIEEEAKKTEVTQKKLRDLENLIEGLIDGGHGTKKERCIFLFSDLLIIASTKRKTGTIRKPSSISHSSLLAPSTLDTNKFKLLMRFPLDDLEITKNSEVGIAKALKEINNLEDDISLLGQMSDKSSSLNIPHPNLDEALKELLGSANKQLTEKHSSDSVLVSLELTVTTQEGIQCLNLTFSSPERKSTFEAAFEKAKKELGIKILTIYFAAATTDRRSPPEFINTLPIRKTRSGLEFTCVAATIGLNSHDLKDVWICNSDGFISQVCILSLQPEPTLASCTGICNARVLCIATIPADNSVMENYYRRRSTLTDKTLSGISISVEDTEEVDSNGEKSPCSTNGNFQLDRLLLFYFTKFKCVDIVHSDTSDEDDENESQDEEAAKLDDTPIHHQQKDGDQQATMWIGTDDGHVHIYNCQDNIRIKKNKDRKEHSAAITCIIYLDNRVFVSLANGEVAIYSRDRGDGWARESETVIIGNQNTPVTKLLAVTGKLWCGCQNSVMVVNTTSLDIELLNTIYENLQKTFSVVSDSSKSVLCMVTSGLGVWISVENSAVIKLFHATSYECLFDVNVSPSVTRMLTVCDDIIRKHKSACLRVISLLTCKDLLWIGTSAGIILTLPLPHLTSSSTKITSLPTITGSEGDRGDPRNIMGMIMDIDENDNYTIAVNWIPQGHTGNVKVLTCVETTPGIDNNVKLTYNSVRPRYARRSIKSKDIFNARRQSTSAALTSKLLVISGGYGYENFKNTETTVSGRDDSTNHLLLWQV
ncbi:Rho guanine nucleotide exchange factor 17 [Nymphon striatum]|nr:Rho guanine nucleotide exchange factor 17 [Nymphon striatum]